MSGPLCTERFSASSFFGDATRTLLWLQSMRCPLL
jgi:hypothetical protein